MSCKITRRKLIQRSAASLLGGTFVLAGAEEEAVAKALSGAAGALPSDDLPDPKSNPFPSGKLGDLKLSRVLLGGNLIGGWAHSRDLMYVSDLFKAYNTEERIMATFRLAEAHGIDAAMLNVEHLPYAYRYNRDFGGRLKVMAQIRASDAKPFHEIDAAANAGVDTFYINGAVGDHYVKHGRIDFLVKMLDHMRAFGLPVGLGAHSLRVIQEAERLGIEADYYVKTFHPENYWSAHPEENREEFQVDGRRYREHDKFHDNMFDLFPDQTAAFMPSVTKPWVAFKIFAAGAIPPADGFNFAFSNGADFASVGMFDFQVAEDARLARQAIESAQHRKRAWA